jgi:hypothetical protein
LKLTRVRIGGARRRISLDGLKETAWKIVATLTPARDAGDSGFQKKAFICDCIIIYLRDGLKGNRLEDDSDPSPRQKTPGIRDFRKKPLYVTA